MVVHHFDLLCGHQSFFSALLSLDLLSWHSLSPLLLELFLEHLELPLVSGELHLLGGQGECCDQLAASLAHPNNNKF
jgi:hypothetical protein